MAVCFCIVFANVHIYATGNLRLPIFRFLSSASYLRLPIFGFPADINKPLRSTKHVLANALNSASASRRVCNNSRDNTEGPSNQVILWKGSWHAHTCIESPRSRSIASTSIQPNLALRLHSATLRPQVKRHKHV